MSTWVFAILAVAGLLAAFLAAITAKAIQQLAWHELQRYCRKRKLDGLFDEIHSLEDEAALAIETTQIIGTLLFVASAMSGFLRYFVQTEISFAYLTFFLITGSTIIFVATLWIPREIATWFGPAYLVSTWKLWKALIVILTPVRIVSRWLEALFLASLRS